MKSGKRALSAFLSLAMLGFAVVMPVWAGGQSMPPKDPSSTTAVTVPSTVSPSPKPQTVITLPANAEPFIEQSPSVLDAAVLPPKQDGGGIVVEETLRGGTHIGQGVSIKNISGHEADWTALLDGDITRFQDSTKPQVLIVHTHTTESYMTYYAGYYNADDVARQTDAAKNVCAVGEVMANRLRAAGIGVIHDTSLYDYPQYTGAYARSEETVRRLLKEHPTIRLVIDLHRDAVLRDAVTRVKPTVTADGQKAAQIMLVLGANDTASNPNPTWQKNVRLGFALVSYLESRTPSLCRPVSLTETNYNQNLLPDGAMLLIEMGADANTFSEAMVSATLVGDALAAIMRSS